MLPGLDALCVTSAGLLYQGRQGKHRGAKDRVLWVGALPHLWYLMKAGKLVPSSQCRKVERGTGKNSSMMSNVAAQPRAPDTLHWHDEHTAFHDLKRTPRCAVAL